MKQRITEKAQFDFIRYANVWEDASALIAGLNPKPGSRLLSIASAGDNTFSLLTTHPEKVIAVDINPIQLYLTEYKMLAIQSFNRSETLAFLGFESTELRWEMYNSLRNSLSTEARDYFDHHREDWVERGVIHAGKFEKYFQLFVRRVLPLIHSQKTVLKLLQNKSAAEQAHFFSKHWNTWRWRALFKIFFSSTVMGKLGRDPAFFEEVKIDVASYLLSRSAEHLSHVNAQTNPFLSYIMTGSFHRNVPHYLEEPHFDVVKSQLHKIQLMQGYAEDAMDQFGPFDGMNLSNIFEYMDTELFNKTANSLIQGLSKNGKLVYWNLMVPRRISKICDGVIENTEMMSDLRPKDNGFFYNTIVIDTKK